MRRGRLGRHGWKSVAPALMAGPRLNLPELSLLPCDRDLPMVVSDPRSPALGPARVLPPAPPPDAASAAGRGDPGNRRSIAGTAPSAAPAHARAAHRHPTRVPHCPAQPVCFLLFTRKDTPSVSRPRSPTFGCTSTAFLGYGLWQRAFGGDPGVLGRTVLLTARGFQGAELHRRFDVGVSATRIGDFMPVFSGASRGAFPGPGAIDPPTAATDGETCAVCGGPATWSPGSPCPDCGDIGLVGALPAPRPGRSDGPQARIPPEAERPSRTDRQALGSLPDWLDGLDPDEAIHDDSPSNGAAAARGS